MVMRVRKRKNPYKNRGNMKSNVKLMRLRLGFAFLRLRLSNLVIITTTAIFLFRFTHNILNETFPYGSDFDLITNQRIHTMNKIMSVAAVALMLAGTAVFAGEECKGKSKKAECSSKKAECSSKKGQECSQKGDEKQCSSGCAKKAEA
jgi:hypothetical protein